MIDRITQYANDILNGNIKSGQSIRSACQRFLDDVEKSKSDDYPYYFDIEEAYDLIDYAESLTIGEGIEQASLILYPWQTFVLGNLNGWRWKSNPKNRRYRESYIQVCRQQGKSMLNGVIASYYGNFTEYQYPQIYLTATKSAQARIVFKEIVKFVNSDSDLEKYFKIKDWKSEIDCKNTQGLIRALGRDTSSIDGFRPFLGVVDK